MQLEQIVADVLQRAFVDGGVGEVDDVQVEQTAQMSNTLPRPAAES